MHNHTSENFLNRQPVKFGFYDEKGYEIIENEECIAPDEKLIESPEYKSSCLSTIKSFFSFSSKSLDSFNFSTNEDVKSINLFNTFYSTTRLIKLRKLMKANNISSYIIPSEDQHQSEYTCEFDQRRKYVSGFTGSSGIAIVTMFNAALSTDSRYFIQAKEQLDDNWVLLKQGIDESWMDWTINETVYEMDRLKQVGDIGIDPKLITWKTGKQLIEKCHENNVKLVNDLDLNLIDVLRKNDRLEIPNNPVYKFDIEYAGLDVASKLQKTRDMMKQSDTSVYISSKLDSIAWLLNLRGNDIEFNPVFFAYMIITEDDATLYIDRAKVNNEIQVYLKDNGIQLRSYKFLWDDLPSLNSKANITLDSNASYSLYFNLPSIYEVKFQSILEELKGIKNEVEIENLKKSQIIDSLAIIRFLSWFNKNRYESLNELDIVDKLYEFRNQNKSFKSLSFATIAASGSNSSIVHYEPTNEQFSQIKQNDILLIDSGAQYFEGTTDITRTIYVENGECATKEMKKAYTLVLNGHLKVAMLKFKKGTSSYEIDSLAREPLLKYGMNYGHGTGHGIDNYICVHSGPCGLSPSETSYNYKPLEAGNFISDEPGYYKEGKFGIRIESDILVKGENNESSTLEFDYLTKIPFCVDLIDSDYLSDDQITWINEYHAEVRDLMSAKLNEVGDNDAIEWLKQATKAI